MFSCPLRIWLYWKSTFRVPGTLQNRGADWRTWQIIEFYYIVFVMWRLEELDLVEILTFDFLPCRSSSSLCFFMSLWNCCKSLVNFWNCWRWHLPLDFLMTHHPQTEKKVLFCSRASSTINTSSKYVRKACCVQAKASVIKFFFWLKDHFCI